jgi:HSP20 family protein
MNLIRFARPSNAVACNTAPAVRTPTDSLENEIDRLFGTPFDSLFASSFGESTPVDIHEDDKAVQLRFELPGARKEDISLEATGERLNVRATRRVGLGPNSREQNFERSYRLGESLDASSVTASYENGVLLVSIPRKQSEQPRKIAVN